MGIRGELFSTRITCEGRTYFFNVKENRMGDCFLTIVESKPTEEDTFDRRSIVIFRDEMKSFLKAFQGALKYMEKPGSLSQTLQFEPAVEEEAPAKGKKRRVVVRRKDSGEAKAEGPEAE